MNIFKNEIGISGTPQHTSYFVGNDIFFDPAIIESLQNLFASKFLILSDDIVFPLYGKHIITMLRKLDKPIIPSIIPNGEKYKNMHILQKAILPFFQSGFDKNAVLICLGAGVVCDMGGLAGSLLLRGIQVVYIPTSLLAQIDAAIGGKTGIDMMLPNGNVLKNMLGTVKQPSIVISDVSLIKTLPPYEIQNALGELFKYNIGWGVPSFENLVKIHQQNLSPENLGELVHECQDIKLSIVQKDPADSNHIRELLNFGHTIGHAVESASNFEISHGRAVAIGINAATKISVKMKLCDEKLESDIVEKMGKLELPTTVTNIKKEQVYRAMKMDKKAGKFVLLKKIGELQIYKQVPREIIQSVLDEILI
jgi:3-dehydroquinate synthase